MVCHLICQSANKSPNQVLCGVSFPLKLRFTVTKMQLLWSYKHLKKNIPNGMFFSNRSLLPKNAFYRKPIPINKKAILTASFPSPWARRRAQRSHKPHPSTTTSKLHCLVLTPYFPSPWACRRAQRSRQPPPKHNSSEATLLILKSDSYQFFKNTSFPLCPYFK
jgi:hypothetical protein